MTDVKEGSPIQLVIVDLDGVLTDGSYLVSDDESEKKRWKRFHTRDFYGFELLNECSIRAAIVTSDAGEHARLQLQRCCRSVALAREVADKVQAATILMKSAGITDWNNVAFIGDDRMDLSLLRKVGVAACPRDADEMIILEIDRMDNGYRMARPGGHGCVREFINLILLINERYKISAQNADNTIAEGDDDI